MTAPHVAGSAYRPRLGSGHALVAVDRTCPRCGEPHELNSFSVSAPLQPARLLSWPADSTLPDRLMLRDLGTASDYAASVAVIGGPHPVLEQDRAEVLASHRPR
jgi:hypothetical protein